MNTSNMVRVKCFSCDKEFDMHPRVIKKYDGDLVIHFNQLSCPHCSVYNDTYKRVFTVNGNEKMRAVECGISPCYCVFEITEKQIKSIDSTGSNLYLHDKISCPKCGKQTKHLRDYKATEIKRARDKLIAQGIPVCRDCGSQNIYIQERGFSTSQAFIGGTIAGGIGLLAGNIGSKKLTFTCLACKAKWEQ